MLNSPPPTGYAPNAINQQSVPSLAQPYPFLRNSFGMAQQQPHAQNFSNAFSRAMPSLSPMQTTQNPQVQAMVRMLQQGGQT
jgi:hypothetical protein